jgi:solute carrier family 25 carnitine/acylcarnitine transporter 20/29
MQVGGESSFMKTTSQLLRNEGVFALFKGMASPVYAIAFQNAVTFSAYNNASRYLCGWEGKGPLPLDLVCRCGFVAGLANVPVVVPIELLKINAQIQTKAATGFWSGPFVIAKEIVRRDGIAGLWRGAPITVLRDVPSFGVYFWVYEASREWMHPGCRQDDSDNAITVLTAGGLAGVFSWAVCYPADIVKTKLQGDPRAYRGIVHCVSVIMQKQGVGGFFVGIAPSLMRGFIVNAGIFAGYEYTLRLMRPFVETDP